jgi:8-oxo-dGTP pyrophosphatase MutT (NUDIX family)
MFIKNQLTENVKLLQKAAIIREGEFGAEVLLLKRSADSFSRPNCWDLPGGNSEWPTAEQASAADLHLSDISREILEETALQVSENIFGLSKLTHLSTYFDNQRQIFTIIFGWVIDFSLTNQAAIQISNEHQKYVWVTQDNLLNYDFGGDKGAFVLDIIINAFTKFRDYS